MASSEHIKILQQGVKAWNAWRMDHRDIIPDLSGLNASTDLHLSPKLTYDLIGDLREVDFSYTNLQNTFFQGFDFDNATFKKADLKQANFSWSVFRNVDFSHSILDETNLFCTSLIGCILYRLKYAIKIEAGSSRFENCSISLTPFGQCRFTDSVFVFDQLEEGKFITCNFLGATFNQTNKFIGTRFIDCNLSKVNFENKEFIECGFERCNLSNTIFRGSKMPGTNFSESKLLNTDFSASDISGSKVYGIAAWDVKYSDTTKMLGLNIAKDAEDHLTVDDLQLAQFIYLLLNNKNIRNIIDTITSKTVLILGRFEENKMLILQAIRTKLRKLNFTPIIFDFQKPASKDMTGTIETLARMARFILADISNPKSVPHELATLIPHLRTTPIQVIKMKGSESYSLIEDYYGSYNWLLKPYEYDDEKALIEELNKVINSASILAEQLRSPNYS